jgi:hypothetical protein
MDISSSFIPGYGGGAGGLPPAAASSLSSIGLPPLGLSGATAAGGGSGAETTHTLRVLMATKERELREVSEYRGAMLEAALAEKVRASITRAC